MTYVFEYRLASFFARSGQTLPPAMFVAFLNSIFLSNDLNEIITTTQQCISLSLKQGT